MAARAQTIMLMGEEAPARPQAGPGSTPGRSFIDTYQGDHSTAQVPHARRVLVIEDDLPIRVMLTDLLQDAGYGVLQASDGFEALQHLRATRPDLIVLDLMMPRVSGWQFLERTRAELDRSNIPVVILSAIKGGGDYPSTLGVAAWLTKPLDVDRLLRAVEELAGPSHAVQRKLRNPESAHTARVLLVEDERAIRDLLIEHLTGEGFTLQAAGTISEAQAQILAAPPALIVLDLMLPGRSGWDFLRERSGDQMLSRIPVLVISAAPQDQLLEAKDLGANAYLSKPFDLDVVSAVVHSFVS